MQLRPIKIVELYIKGLCEIFGDAFNVILRDALSSFEGDRNSLATLLGALVGLYDGNKVPRRIECLDLVRAFGLKEGFDDSRVYGKPDPKAADAREKFLLPKFDALFSRASEAAIKAILSMIEDPFEGLRILEESFGANPAIVDFSLEMDGKEIRVILCYDNEEAAKKLSELSFGGFSSLLAANLLARTRGFSGARWVESKRISPNCVLLRYEALGRYRY